MKTLFGYFFSLHLPVLVQNCKPPNATSPALLYAIPLQQELSPFRPTAVPLIQVSVIESQYLSASLSQSITSYSSEANSLVGCTGECEEEYVVADVYTIPNSTIKCLKRTAEASPN